MTGAKTSNAMSPGHGGVFADYLYTQPGTTWDGQWDYVETTGRRSDRVKFEDLKTRFYRFQGWDQSTGRPNRSTLESMGLIPAADELEKLGLLGA